MVSSIHGLAITLSKTKNILNQLREYESRNVTFVEPDGSWPIVWERARGVQVVDVEGKKYLDLTGAFGVAAAGHANPRVVAAGRKQMGKLLHAMGDVHPHSLKAELAHALSRITFERWGKWNKPKKSLRGKTIFCNSGFEAVEAALKTALLVTGKTGLIAFEGGYHGLGHGALNATHRQLFKKPFRSQIAGFGRFAPFPKSSEDLSKTESVLHKLFKKGDVGAVLVEPMQARGGIQIPPLEFLRLLRRLCDQHGALLILDEIYTGFGRTGKWFACEHSGVTPDLICLGKALTGGFPLSACVGRADHMNAWPETHGEAIHTSTFLGHPVGCAMAMAQMGEIQQRDLVKSSAGTGAYLLMELQQLKAPQNSRIQVRGVGLMAGIEFTALDGSPDTTLRIRIMKQLLHRGFIILPEGEHGNILGFTPPLTITRPQLKRAVNAIQDLLNAA